MLDNLFSVLENIEKDLIIEMYPNFKSLILNNFKEFHDKHNANSKYIVVSRVSIHFNLDFLVMKLFQIMISKNPQKYKAKAEENSKFVEFNRLFDSIKDKNVR